MSTEEKRKYKRFHKEVTVHFDIITSMSASREVPAEGDTTSVNISMGGVLFASSKPIPISSIIECKFVLPNIEDPVYAKAKVVRIEETEFGQYDLGIQFIAVAKDDYKLLGNYLAS